MSIRSELNNTKHYLRESRKAILGRGGEISEKAGLKDIPEAVWSIPADASLAFREDSEVAYEKVVPVGAEEYALVKSLGGMSYKTINLYNAELEQGGINNLGALTSTTTRLRNVDFIVLNAGTYTLSFPQGFNAIVRTYSVDEEYVSSESGSSYNNSNILTFTISATRKIKFNFKKSADGAILPSEISEIMLNVGSTALPYEPFFEGLRDTKPTSLESRGANLFDGSLIKIGNFNGVKIEYDNVTQIFTFNGTCTGGTNASLSDVNIKGKKGENYTLKLEISSGSVTVPTSAYANAFFGSGDTLGQQTNWFSRTLASSGSTKKELTHEYITKFWFYISTGVVFDNLKVKIMLAQTNDTDIPYKPFSAEPIDTKALPEAVQSLDGWGLGIDAKYNNHIEWRNGRVIYRQMLGEKVFNGTEYFWINSHLNDNGTKAYQTGFTSLNGVAPLSNVFEGLTWVGSKKTYTIQNVSDGGLVFITDGVQTLDEFKAYLAEQYNSGNPVTVVYALAEPIETDITHLFTDASPFLKVQGGGVVKANNERKEAVPSTLKYTIKVG